MVNLATPATVSIPPSANEVALEARTTATGKELREQRIRHLRQVIETGQYRVAADDLADALLRSVHQAN